MQLRNVQERSHMQLRNVVAVAVLSLFFLAACGGGGSSSTTNMPPTGTPEPDDTPPSGSRAPYTVSVTGGTFGAMPVSVSAEAVVIGSRTVRLDAGTQVGDRPGHHRVFDVPGATSGPAIEVHYLGENAGYNHIQFGSWATGTVSPNPGFKIEDYGAFLAPSAAATGQTPVSNLPITGTAQWLGSYAGYVDREGVGVSQVVGAAQIEAFFSPNQFGDTGALVVFFSSPDPNRSSFAPLIESRSRETGRNLSVGRVQMTTPITGSTFGGDVTDTRTVLGHTVPGGTTISADTQGGLLYSPGAANSGGLSGGFFGSRGGEAGGTYQFAVGVTKAAGSFGGKLQ